MEEELSHLEMRGVDIMEQLEDPLLPILDREELEQELEWIVERIVELEEDDDCTTITLESFESESIGPDEYDREGLIIYGHPEFIYF